MIMREEKEGYLQSRMSNSFLYNLEAKFEANSLLIPIIDALAYWMI